MKLNIKRNAFIFIALITTCFYCFASSAETNTNCYKLSNGIPVYIRDEENSDFMTVSIVVSGGISCYDREHSGIEESVFDLLSCGSEKYSFEKISQFDYRTRSSIGSWTERQGSVYYLKSIDYYFDESFDIYMDGFLNPLFEQKEYDKLMNDNKQSIQSMMNSPESRLGYEFRKEVYKNHPYSTECGITPSSFKNITLEKIREYYKTIKNSRRLSVVAAGDFNDAELVKKLESYLGKISAGTEEILPVKAEGVAVYGEPVVTCLSAAEGAGVAFNFYSAPSYEEDDYYSLSVAMDIYSDILFNVVRETYGDCYTPQAFVTGDKVGFAGEALLNVSNLKDFAKHVKIARDIMKDGKVISGKDSKGNFIYGKIKDVFESYINSKINRKFQGEKTVMSLNTRLAGSLLEYGDPYKTTELFERIKKVTPESTLKAFNKYIVNGSSRWFAVTGPSEKEEISFEE